MRLQQPFPTAQVEPVYEGGFTLIPAGQYDLVLTGSEPKQNDKGNGMLIYDVQVISGQYNGHKFKHILNLWHTDPKAAATAWGQLAALAAVTGHGGQTLNDTDDVINTPFKGDVTVSGSFNNIKTLYDAQGNQPGKKAAGPVQPTAAPNAAAQPAAGGWGTPAQPAAGSWGPPAATQPAAQPAGQWGAPVQPAAAPAAAGRTGKAPWEN